MYRMRQTQWESAKLKRPCCFNLVLLPSSQLPLLLPTLRVDLMFPTIAVPLVVGQRCSTTPHFSREHFLILQSQATRDRATTKKVAAVAVVAWACSPSLVAAAEAILEWCGPRDGQFKTAKSISTSSMTSSLVALRIHCTFLATTKIWKFRDVSKPILLYLGGWTSIYQLFWGSPGG